MENCCVYKIFDKFEAFYTNKNQFGNIQISIVVLISNSMIYYWFLKTIFPLCLDLECLGKDYMHPNDPEHGNEVIWGSL